MNDEDFFTVIKQFYSDGTSYHFAIHAYVL